MPFEEISGRFYRIKYGSFRQYNKTYKLTTEVIKATP